MNLSVFDVFNSIATIILIILLPFTSGLKLTPEFFCHDRLTRTL